MARTTAAYTALALLALALGCGGGGGGGSSTDALSIGLVSGTTPTTTVVRFTNPHTTLATLSIPVSLSPFRVNPAVLSGTTVAGGATIDLPVIFTPQGPGATTGEAHLTFHAGTNAITTAIAMHATAEAVTLAPLTANPAFGTVPFGASAQRAVTLANRATFSLVTISSASFPTADYQVVSPALPFTVQPGQLVTVTLELRPWVQLGDASGTVTLRSAHAQGSAAVPVTATAATGTAIVDLGSLVFTDAVSEVIEFDVPADVFSITVEGDDPSVPLADTGFPEELGGLLTPATARRVRVVQLVGPDGTAYANDMWTRNEPVSQSATIPYTDQAALQLAVGGGRYRVQLELLNPPVTHPVVGVRYILKAAPGGATPPTGVLDLNVWVGSNTGITAATASTHVALQTGLGEMDTILQGIGIQLGTVRYFGWNDGTGTQVSDFVLPLMPQIPTLAAAAPVALNLFIYNGDGGQAPTISGPLRQDTMYSWAAAGWLYTLSPRGNLFAHEALHYLGLWHVWEDSITDTTAAGLNLMNIDLSAALTPGQGHVVRSHPLVRHP